MLLLWKLALVASELYLHMVMNDMRHAGHIMQTLGARLRVVMGMTSVRVLQAVTSLLLKQDRLLLLSLFQTRQTNSGLVSSFRPWPSRCESLVAIQVLINQPIVEDCCRNDSNRFRLATSTAGESLWDL